MKSKSHADWYQELLELGKGAKRLLSLSYLLEWDKETYMPKGGAEFRGELSGYLASLLHKEKTNPKFENILSHLIDIETGKIHATTLTEPEQAALKEWRKDLIKEKKLPVSFVKEFAQVTANASIAWKNAKEENNFNSFAPHLEKIISLCKKQADYLGYNKHAYDALLDLYEPGMTTHKCHTLFATLKPFLITLVKKIHPTDNQSLYGNFSQEKQEKFSSFLLNLMGLDPDHFRIDRSIHPFCVPLHPTDLRIITHVVTSHITANISAIMHEGGHALYELNLPKEHFGSPLCEAISMGIHESQSRLWETFIGQSRPLWDYLYPHLQEHFPHEFNKVPFELFFRAINKIEPSPIRVYADEVTYILHIILRFELECALIEGKLKVADLPAAWDAKMHDYLGLQPQSDSEGCLQDIHWSLGHIGYFPSYALGNLYAAQFLATIKKTFPDWDKRIRQGDLLFIRDWLRTHIHYFGREYSAPALLEKVTGSDLSPIPYMNYLTEKYT